MPAPIADATPVETRPARFEAWRVLIVAEHASARYGGEAALPLHYFRIGLRRGARVWLVTHARVRDELRSLFSDDEFARIQFVTDNWINRFTWRLGRCLPDRLAYLSTGYVSRLVTQWRQRSLARRLVRLHGIDVVHQPMPVSPREPSLLRRLGAPVVIGPLNGGMSLPPAFHDARERRIAWLENAARRLSRALNRWMPAKREAAMVLVANARTRDALPPGLRGQVVELVENGVDLACWTVPVRRADGGDARPLRLVYLGRLVALKGVDLLLEAFALAARDAPMTLTLVGDGPERAALTAQARRLGLLDLADGRTGRVHFAGWQAQPACAERLAHSDVLVLPSLRECGGAVVLEAMACGLPVIATAWGGPLDYLDDRTGILVAPTSRQALVDGFAQAMTRLARSPGMRRRLGEAGRRRVESDFDWERKIEQVYALFQTLDVPARPR